MNGMTAAPRAGWLSSLIERARASGVANDDIAAALEEGIAFHPLRIARGDADRLVAVMPDADMTLDDLIDSADQDR